MAGIKIINILKDDTFPEILEVFRAAPAGEVIFVLPKNGKIFRKEDHFAAFASEAAGAGKTISVLSNNPDINSWARKYKFNVMSASKPVSSKKVDTTPVQKTIATEATSPLPMDEEILNLDEEDNVVETSDRTMGKKSEEESEDEELGIGMHIEDEDGPVAELTAAIDGVRPGAPRKTVPVSGKAAKPAPVPVERAVVPEDSLDYIDAVWRDKAAQTASSHQASPRQSTRWTLPTLPKGKGWSKKVATGIFAASILVLGTTVYMTTGSAQIVLVPAHQNLDSKITVQASDVFSSVDANFSKIPGQLLQMSKTVTREVVATGQRDIASKARGKVTVYNEFSSSPQPLVATTRFESAGGLIFRTLQSVTVPGSTVQNGKLVAGSITIDVVADKPGTTYNIAPGIFTIPAFKERGDTDRYGKITATSTVAFSGGATGPSKFITQANYDEAKAAATAAVKEQIKTAFLEQASGMTILEGIAPTIGDIQSSANPDDAADKVSVTVTGTLKTVAFRKDQLDELVSETILKKDRLVVIPSQLTLKYGDISFKQDLGVLVFSVSYKGPGYTPLDEDAIIKDIQGKTANEIREFFRDREGIQSATVTLSPFWVRSVPQNSKKINIRLNYDSPAQ